MGPRRRLWPRLRPAGDASRRFDLRRRVRATAGKRGVGGRAAHARFSEVQTGSAGESRRSGRRQVELDTVLRCYPPGVPRIGPPAKIVQTANEVVFLYDDYNGSFFRVIPTDGRPRRQGLTPSYLGNAVGSFEGDTLVVETVNFTDETWLTDNGAFHTKDLESRGTAATRGRHDPVSGRRARSRGPRRAMGAPAPGAVAFDGRARGISSLRGTRPRAHGRWLVP